MAASSSGLPLEAVENSTATYKPELIIRRWRWRKISSSSGMQSQQSAETSDMAASQMSGKSAQQARVFAVAAQDEDQQVIIPRRARRSRRDDEVKVQDTPRSRIKLCSAARDQRGDTELRPLLAGCECRGHSSSSNMNSTLQRPKRRRQTAHMVTTSGFATPRCRASGSLILLIICSIICFAPALGPSLGFAQQLQLASDDPAAATRGGDLLGPFASLLEPQAASFSLADGLQALQQQQPPLSAGQSLVSALEAHSIEVTPLGRQTDDPATATASGQPSAMPGDQDLLLQLLRSTGSVDEASKLIETLLLEEQNNHNHQPASSVVRAHLEPVPDYNQVRASIDLTAGPAASAVAASAADHQTSSVAPASATPRGHLNPAFVDLQPDRVASDSEESPFRVSVEPPLALSTPTQLASTSRPPGNSSRGLLDEILAATAAAATTHANVNVHYDDEPVVAGHVVTAALPVSGPEARQRSSQLLDSIFRASDARPSASDNSRTLTAADGTAESSANSVRAPGIPSSGEPGDNLSNNESITSLLMRAGDASRQLIANYSTWINHEQPARKLLPALTQQLRELSKRRHAPTAPRANNTAGRTTPLRGGDFGENDSLSGGGGGDDDRPRGGPTASHPTAPRRPGGKAAAANANTTTTMEREAAEEQIFSVGSQHEPTRMRPASRVVAAAVNNLQDDTEKIRLSKKNETGLHRIVFINSMPHWTPARTRTTLKMPLERETSTTQQTPEAPTISSSSTTPAAPVAYVEMNAAVFAQETTAPRPVVVVEPTTHAALNESQVPSTQLYSVEPYELGASSSAGMPQHRAPTTPTLMLPETTRTTERPATTVRIQQQQQQQQLSTASVERLQTAASANVTSTRTGKRKSSRIRQHNLAATAGLSSTNSTPRKPKARTVKPKKRLKSAEITKRPTAPPVELAVATTRALESPALSATTELAAEATIPPSATPPSSPEPTTGSGGGAASTRAAKSLNLARLFLGTTTTTTGHHLLEVSPAVGFAPTTTVQQQPSSSLGHLDHLYGSSSFSLMPTTRSMMSSTPTLGGGSSVRMLPPDVAAPTPDSLSVVAGAVFSSPPSEIAQSASSGSSTAPRWRAIELPLREHSARRPPGGNSKQRRSKPNLTTSTTRMYDPESYNLDTRPPPSRVNEDSIRRSTVTTTSTFSPLMVMDDEQQPGERQQPTDYSHAQVALPVVHHHHHHHQHNQVVVGGDEHNDSPPTTQLELDRQTTPLLLLLPATARTTAAPQQQQQLFNRTGASHGHRPAMLIDQAQADFGANRSQLMVQQQQQQQQQQDYGKRLVVGGSSPAPQLPGAEIELATDQSPPTQLATDTSAGDSITANSVGGRGQQSAESAGANLRPQFQDRVSTTELPLTSSSSRSSSSSAGPPALGPLVYVEPSRVSSSTAATPPAELDTPPLETPTLEFPPQQPPHGNASSTVLSLDDPLPSLLHHNRLSSLFQYKLANRTGAPIATSGAAAAAAGSSSPFLLHIGTARGDNQVEGQQQSAAGQFVYPFAYQQIKDSPKQQQEPQAATTNSASAGNNGEQAKLNNVALSQMVARLIGESTARASANANASAPVSRAQQNLGFYGNFYHQGHHQFDHSNRSTVSLFGDGGSMSPNATSAAVPPGRLFRREKNRARVRAGQPTAQTTLGVTYGQEGDASTTTTSTSGNKNYELIKMSGSNDDDDQAPANNSIVQRQQQQAVGRHSPSALSAQTQQHGLRALSNGSDVFITSTTLLPPPPNGEEAPSLPGLVRDNSGTQQAPGAETLQQQPRRQQGNNGASESGLSGASSSEYENSENAGDLNVYVKPVARDEQPSSNRWLLPTASGLPPLQQQHSQRARAASRPQRVDKRKRRREPPILPSTEAAPAPEQSSTPGVSSTSTTSSPPVSVVDSAVEISARPAATTTTTSTTAVGDEISTNLDDNSLGNLFSRLPQAYRSNGPAWPVNVSAQLAGRAEQPAQPAGEYATAATSEQPAATSLSEPPPPRSSSTTERPPPPTPANASSSMDESMAVDGSQSWRSSSLSPLLADDYRAKSLSRTMINLGAPSTGGAGGAALASNKSAPTSGVRVVKVAKLRSRQAAPTPTSTSISSTTLASATTSTSRPTTAATASTRGAPGSRWRSFSAADRLSKQPITPPRLNFGGVRVRGDRRASSSSSSETTSRQEEMEESAASDATTPMAPSVSTSTQPESTTPPPPPAQEQSAVEPEQPIVVVLSPPSAGRGLLESTNLDKVSSLLRATIERVAATSTTRAPITTTTSTMQPTTTTTTSTTTARPTPTTDFQAPAVTEPSATVLPVEQLTQQPPTPRRTVFKGSRDALATRTTTTTTTTTTLAPTTTTSGPVPEVELGSERALETLSSSDQGTSLNAIRGPPPTTTTTSTTEAPAVETTSRPASRRPSQSILETHFRSRQTGSGGESGASGGDLGRLLQQAAQPKRNQRHQPAAEQPPSRTTSRPPASSNSGELLEGSDLHSQTEPAPPVGRQGLNSFQRAAIVTIIICCVLLVACLLVAAISIKCNSLVASSAASSARRRRKRCDALARLKANGYGLSGPSAAVGAQDAAPLERPSGRSRSLGPLAAGAVGGKHSRTTRDEQRAPQATKQTRKALAKAQRAAAKRAKSCGGGGAKLLLANELLHGNSSDGGQVGSASSAESTASLCMSTSSEGMNFLTGKNHHHHQRQHREAGGPPQKTSHAGQDQQQQQAAYASRTIRERISGTITSRLLRLHLPRLMPYFTPPDAGNPQQQQQMAHQRLASNLSHYQQQQQQQQQQQVAAQQKLGVARSQQAARVQQNFLLAPRGQPPAPQLARAKARAPTKAPACLFARREVSGPHQCGCASCAQISKLAQQQQQQSMWSFKENTASGSRPANGSRNNAKLPFGTASSVLRNHHHQESAITGVSMLPVPPLRTLSIARQRAAAAAAAGDSDCMQPDNASTQHSQMDNEHHMLIDDGANTGPLASGDFLSHHHHNHQLHHLLGHSSQAPTTTTATTTAIGAGGVYRNLGSSGATAAASLSLLRELETRHYQAQQPARNYVPRNHSDLLAGAEAGAVGHASSEAAANNNNNNIERIEEDSRAEAADDTDEISESDNYYNLEQHHQQHQQRPFYQMTNHDTSREPHGPARAAAAGTTENGRQQQREVGNCNCNLILYPL